MQKDVWRVPGPEMYDSEHAGVASMQGSAFKPGGGRHHSRQNREVFSVSDRLGGSFTRVTVMLRLSEKGRCFRYGTG